MLFNRAVVGWIFLVGLETTVFAQQPSAVRGPVSAPFTSSTNWVDLTHSFDKSTIYWPTENGFKLLVEKHGMTEKGYFYASNRFEAAEHGGTHLDAPLHFSKDGKSVDQLSLDRLIGEAAVIDVTDACSRNADYQVGVNDLRDWELQHERQLVDVILMLHTGFGRLWHDRARYLGTERKGPEAVADLHFPGLAPEAALWLAEHRSVKAVGIDTASIDFGQSQRFQSHVTLFKHDIPALENVANLNLLPPAGATVVALPMKIASGTGAPIRIVASIPD